MVNVMIGKCKLKLNEMLLYTQKNEKLKRKATRAQSINQWQSDHYGNSSSLLVKLIIIHHGIQQLSPN